MDRGIGRIVMLRLSQCVVFLGFAVLPGQSAAYTTLCDVARNDLLAIERNIEMFHAIRGEYPRTLEDLKSEWLTRDRGVSSAKADPWGQPYSYSQLPSGYELYSNGADRLPKTDDDISQREPGWLSACARGFTAFVYEKTRECD